MTRFEIARAALGEARRDAEKEATRLEITQPELSAEARTRADGLADALRLIEGLSKLSDTLAVLAEPA